MEMPATFKKNHRLLKKAEYALVFRQHQALSTKEYLRIYYAQPIKKNSEARIGLVVSKKVAKKAVHRNYMKRALREWFRIERRLLPPADYIFMVKKSFTADEIDKVTRELIYFKRTIGKRLS
ncbi:MAG: ribonuclease P protein component [Haemophilus parainfluenzae]|nr:MAG: ribonuclease P protein component [Haemophilus parainfluenzae]